MAKILHFLYALCIGLLLCIPASVDAQIQNGSFTNGSTDWIIQSNFFCVTSGFTNYRTSPGYAFMAAADGQISDSNNIWGTLTQSFTMPASFSSASVQFYVKITTLETTLSAQNDYMTCTVTDGTTNIASQITLSNLNASADYQLETITIPQSMAGHTLTLTFYAQNNATLGTVFRVDDVSLVINGSSGNSSNFTLTVNNVNGVTRDNASVKLYTQNYGSVVSTLVTDASGQVTFSGLSNGTYPFEVYYKPAIANAPVANNTEFWGAGTVTINGSSVSQTFNRIQPYIQSGPSFAPADINTTQTSKGQFVVQNPLPYAENSYVELWVDQDKLQSWDFDLGNSGSASSVSAGGNSIYPFSVSKAAMNPGNYSFYAVVYSNVNGSYIITDQYNWTNAFNATSSTIQWSGYTWNISNGTGASGTNDGCSSSSNVFVDAQQNLHLKIMQIDGVWNFPELDCQSSLGYGEYRYYVNSRIDQLDKNLVFGLFTYQPNGKNVTPQENEIDIEFSTWNNQQPLNNGDYTIQYRHANDDTNYGPKTFFNMTLNGTYSTHKFQWQPGSVHFQSYDGHYAELPSTQTYIASADFTTDVPVVSNEKPIINLHAAINQSTIQSGYVPPVTEVILQSFTFTPLSATCTTPTAPTLLYGSDDCSQPAVLSGSQTATLSFSSTRGNSFQANVSKYPYDTPNVIFTSPCQTTINAIQTNTLVPGMLYRWNMYAFGGTDCSSCQSAVSLTKYFGLPPQISSSGTQLPANGLITISTQTQSPGAGAAVNYRWLKDGNPYRQGNSQDTINVTTPGNYSLIIDYSGSALCSGATSTASSNTITVTSNQSCIPSNAASLISSTPATTANGPATQLSVVGGTLGTNASWKWYQGGCGATYVNNGASIVVPSGTGQTYYVRAEGDCGTTTCDSITLSSSGGCISSVAPDSVKQTIISNGPNGPTVQLAVVGGQLGTNASWHWYQGGCGGTALADTGPTITVNPTATTEYFVRAEGCDVSSCVSTLISVTPNCDYSILPTSISASTDHILPGADVQLTLNGGSLGTNATWIWTTGSCDAPSFTSGHATTITVTPTATTTYYVRGFGQCNTPYCTRVTVNVVSPPTISTVSPVTAKTGTAVTITGSNFDQSSVVTFGGVNANSITVVDSTTIVAVIGQGSSGDVVVTTSAGTASFTGFTYLFSLPPDNFNISVTSATCTNASDGQIIISALQTMNYTATLTGNGLNASYNFTANKNITNLPAGRYSLCFTVDGQPDYELCDSVTINQPPRLSVYASINSSIHSLYLSLGGGSQYFISLNGQDYATSDSNITLPLLQGNNILSVSTDKLCQGSYKKIINVSDDIIPYPDPFEGILNLNIGLKPSQNVLVEVHSAVNGRVVFSQQYKNISGVLQLDLSTLDSGVYALRLITDDVDKLFKVLKK